MRIARGLFQPRWYDISTYSTILHISESVSDNRTTKIGIFEAPWPVHRKGSNAGRDGHSVMRERYEVALTPTTTPSSMVRIDKGNCKDRHDYDDRREFGCSVETGHGGLLRTGGDDDGLLYEREQLISLSPSLVVTIDEPLSTSSQSSSRTSTISPLSTSILSFSTSSLSSSSSSSSTHVFTPTGYQTIVPIYPPFSFSSSSSSSSSTPFNTTNRSSLGTKFGLGLGIPFLVLLTLLLTLLVHRRQARLAKLSSSHYYHHHHHHHHQHHQHRPRLPEMTTTAAAATADTRLYPAPSSRFSTAGSVFVTPAPGIITTPTPTPTQLFGPVSPSSLPPEVPKRNSARLFFAGPLNSHPPPSAAAAARPASSIYDEDDNSHAVRESMVERLGGNGVANVLSQYLDTNPSYLNGPWDPGQVEDVPALPLPLKTTARARLEEQTRQHLAVDVDNSPGGIEEVSPLSSSGSGPYIPARISGMSGMSPVSPGRTRSRRTT